MAGTETLKKTFARAPEFVSRNVAGEVILVPVAREPSEAQSIYTLNEVAAFAWAQIDGTRTGEDICAAVLAEFEVPEKTARADIGCLLSQLEEVGAVEAV